MGIRTVEELRDHLALAMRVAGRDPAVAPIVAPLLEPGALAALG